MIAGYVLAGGLGRRVGADKARLPGRSGWPLATQVAVAMRGAGLGPVWIVRHDADPDPWPTPDGGAWPVLRDVDGDRHPLRGIAAALADAAARGEGIAVVAPADWSDPDPAVIAALVEAAPAIARGARDEPLLGAYPTALAATARALADAEAPTWRLADGLARVDRAVADVDWPADVHDPIAAFVDALPWLDGEARARAVAGEVARLAARGVRLRG